MGPDKHTYLCLFTLPKPQPEHARISEVISACCGGDFKRFVSGNTLGFVFQSSKPPHSLDFSRVLMADDQTMYFELADYFAAQGYGAIRGWLNSHGFR